MTHEEMREELRSYNNKHEDMWSQISDRFLNEKSTSGLFPDEVLIRQVLDELEKESLIKFSFSEAFDSYFCELTDVGIAFIENHQKKGVITKSIDTTLQINEIAKSTIINNNIAEQNTTCQRGGRSVMSLNKKVFVVHGRNMKTRNAMFDFLEAIGLEPLEWDEIRSFTGKGSPTIGELLNAGFTKAYAIIVLFTPDEVAKLNEEFISKSDYEYERNLTPQARPNVLFEAGMAMGHNPNRTVLVEIGKLRPFSDIAGINCIRMSNTPESRASLRETLKTIGLDIKETGTRWLTAGDFSLRAFSNAPLEINLSNATEFWNPDGVSHRTLVREEANENFTKLRIDFIEHKPLYVGYAVKLGKKDWTEYYDNDKSISFSVFGSPEIKNIVLEVKGESKDIIAKKNIAITSSERKYKFKLKELTDFSDEFSKMTELVFLFTAENVDGAGTVEISNLKIT